MPNDLNVIVDHVSNVYLYLYLLDPLGLSFSFGSAYEMHVVYKDFLLSIKSSLIVSLSLFG